MSDVLGFSQANWSLTVTTPLGTDKLLLTDFDGEERMSALFDFRLTMASEYADLDLSQIVGAAVTVTLTGPDGEKRYFNGIVGRIVTAGLVYYADLHPWLWMLGFTTDSRIFQNMTVPDIITQVFDDLGFTDYRNALTATYAEREYCVQYQETALAFVSRLMEDEGIFYFFEHEDGKHTLVLADDASAHADCPGAASVPFLPLPPGKEWLEMTRVQSCTLEQRVVTGKYQADDFNFQTPTTELKANVAGTANTLQVYEYPGNYEKKDQGDARAKLRIEAFEAPATELSGTSDVRAFSAGYKFALTDHPRSDMNASYVLKSVGHRVRRREYSNTFAAQPADLPFRPPRLTPVPRIHGSQTAIVVGKQGEEIWTDEYGRIKVQFHWDQLGQNDENSSCWIRVVHGWAGKNWGAMFLPRIGQEVVVSFLEGNPDRPLVTGSVYNSEQPVPYGLPDEQTKSTVKSNSSKGGEGFNEIRFEDKKDSEEVFVHAQKDMVVTVLNDRTKSIGNDETITVKQNRTATIEEGDETLTVSKGSRSVTVSEGDNALTVSQGNRTVAVETGNETHSVAGTRDVTVTGNETRTNEADFSQTVSGSFTLTVDGDITIKANGSLTIEAGQSLTLKAGTSLEASSGTDLTAKSGTGLSLSGGTTMELKGSASGTVDGGGMLTVKGGMVKIN